MAGVRPEIIFVGGPQRHERAVLMGNELVAGRSRQADILLREPTISRQQLKFSLIPDGWAVENLSDRRIVINGKSYKRGKQILLASGDVIACGAETEMLFVDATDDPGEVLGAYREAHPQQAPQPVAPPPPPDAEDSADGPPTAPVPAEEPETFSFEPERPERRAEPDEPEPDSADVDAARKKRRTRLYLIAFGVYAVLMIGVIVGLASLKDKDGGRRRVDAPPMLSRTEILDALSSPLEKSPNPDSSARALQRARQFYLQRTASDEYLYRAIVNYRLYLAFRRPAERTMLPRDERQFRQAQAELADRILEHYRNAYALEQGQRWREALRAFNNVLDYFPSTVAEQDPEVMNQIIENVRSHTAYIAHQMGDDDD